MLSMSVVISTYAIPCFSPSAEVTSKRELRIHVDVSREQQNIQYGPGSMEEVPWCLVASEN